MSDRRREELIASILAATSGSTCRSCRLRLIGREMGEQTAGDEELVRMHLAHCPSCRAVEATLTWLPTVLPSLRELPADAAFTEAVLEATTRAPRGRAKGWYRSAAEWWRRWTERPRFAVEAAYLATVVLVLTVGPASLGTLPQRTAAWLRGEDGGLLTAGTSLAQLAETGRRNVGGELGPSAERLRALRVDLYRQLRERSQGSRRGLEQIGGGVGEFLAALLGGGEGIGAALQKVGEGFTWLVRGTTSPHMDDRRAEFRPHRRSADERHR